MKLPIITFPNPILEKEAEDVAFPIDNTTKTLIDDMWDTVKGEGVGLAAPQVGVSKKICIINMSETDFDEPQRDLTLINPKIIFESQVENLMVEGCLSFPYQYYEIWRPANITVEYFTPDGKKKNLRAKYWLARIIQHEVGHLYGDVFINKGGRKLDEKELGSHQYVD